MKKIKLLSLCLAMLLSVESIWAQCPFSGNGTQSDPWNISDQTGTTNSVHAYISGSTLFIYGNGYMADFWSSLGGEAPWNNPNCYSNPSSIQTIVFQTGSDVKNIGERAFKNLSNLQTITIPNSVIKINAEAFMGSGLKTLTIENGSSTLEFDRSYHNYNYYYDWFTGCPLQTLHLGRNYTEPNTSYRPFKGTSIQNLTIGSAVNSIGTEAFANCGNLQNVTIEDHTGTLSFNMANNVFNQTPVKTLYLGRNISYSMGGDVTFRPFVGKTSLTSLTISSQVEEILSYCFQGCTGLTKLIIPDNVAEVGNSAFDGCTGLDSVIIGAGVGVINERVFRGCSSLPKIIIPHTVNSIGTEAFANCGNLQNVTIEDHTGTLSFNMANNVFNQTPVKTLYLGRDISYSMGGDATYRPFAGKTSLQTLSIGCLVSTIPQDCFNGCSGLNSITSYNSDPPQAQNNCFNGVNKTTCTVTVPTSATSAYKAANGWSEFQNYTEDASIYCNPILTGSVTIVGTAVFGEILTADTSQLSGTPPGALGELTYQWKRGITNIGNDQTYTLVQSDIGQTITVTVTAANYTGSVTSNPTGIVQKATQTPPPAPTLDSKTSTSITLNEITGCEYRRDGGNWQTSATFSDLTPNTCYKFTQRKAETATHLPSAPSEESEFCTEPLGIHENPLQNITIYPNPTTGELRIESYELQVTGIEIFDIYGKNVESKFPSKNLEGWQPKADGVVLDISNFSSGIYFLKIHTENGIVMKKVVKE